MEKKMRLIISVLTGAVALGLVPTLEAQKTPRKEAAPKIAPTEKDGCVTRDSIPHWQRDQQLEFS